MSHPSEDRDRELFELLASLPQPELPQGFLSRTLERFDDAVAAQRRTAKRWTAVGLAASVLAIGLSLLGLEPAELVVQTVQVAVRLATLARVLHLALAHVPYLWAGAAGLSSAAVLVFVALLVRLSARHAPAAT